MPSPVIGPTPTASQQAFSRVVPKLRPWNHRGIFKNGEHPAATLDVYIQLLWGMTRALTCFSSPSKSSVPCSLGTTTLLPTPKTQRHRLPGLGGGGGAGEEASVGEESCLCSPDLAVT